MIDSGNTPLRDLGTSGLHVSPVSMGCWPIAGITSLDVNDRDSLETLAAAFEHGITHFDTALCYGLDGESERLIHRALGSHRQQITIATKGGIEWLNPQRRVTDGRRATLLRQCESSLKRLNCETIDLYYLHSPDPQVPIAESAGAIRDLQRQGKVAAAGICNATLAQIQAFHAVCPLAAVQLRFNLLQRGIEDDIVPWCRANRVAVASYWPLMKGVLAGKMRRDYRFDPADSRLKYEIYREPYWSATQDVLDQLEAIAKRLNCTIAQVVISWTIQRAGITTALCGAKRAWQIIESAGAMPILLDDHAQQTISAAYQAWQSAVPG